MKKLGITPRGREYDMALTNVGPQGVHQPPARHSRNARIAYQRRERTEDLDGRGQHAGSRHALEAMALRGATAMGGEGSEARWFTISRDPL
jgi:hypothetical protein